jgi:tetratricopeptide (TPR) repeat protein
LTNLNQSEWRAILARLRRARLLTAEDRHHPGQLDAHPLVREYFGEQLRSERAEAWKECNKRLYEYYRTLAPPLPNSFMEMEPLFLAVICGCNAGLFRQALHEVYIPRIQRGNASFAANILGSRGALLSVLAHFFEQGCWGSPVATAVDGESLTEGDQLFILMQAALYLTVTRGSQAPEVRLCYERAESLCHSLNDPLLLYVALVGQWRYSQSTDKLIAAIEISKRVCSVAQAQNDPALMIGAYSTLAVTLYHLGEIETARKYTMNGLRIWRSGTVRSPVEEVDAPIVTCTAFEAIIQWHAGEIPSCHATMAEAISLAKELNDIHALAVAIFWASVLSYYEHDPVNVERCASDLTELATHRHFRYWQACGAILRGWARSTLGEAAEGILWIQEGIQDNRIAGTIINLPLFLALKAETLMRADRIAEALEAIKEAGAMAERTGERYWHAELHRLRGVFLTAMGADETEIEASFCEAIRIAKEQKSVSLAKRAEATCAEYRRQKATGSGGRGFRLPLW